MTLCLTSTDPKFDEIYLSNFATINVLDVIRRIPGVGRVSNIGSRYYAMQIWAQPDKLANFGLTVQDLQNALKDQNRESAAGVLGQQPVQGLDITIPITTQGRLSTVGQFEDIVVRANANGSIIRLRMWHVYLWRLLHTIPRVVSMVRMQRYWVFTCCRVPMRWR